MYQSMGSFSMLGPSISEIEGILAEYVSALPELLTDSTIFNDAFRAPCRKHSDKAFFPDDAIISRNLFPDRKPRDSSTGACEYVILVIGCILEHKRGNLLPWFPARYRCRFSQCEKLPMGRWSKISRLPRMARCSERSFDITEVAYTDLRCWDQDFDILGVPKSPSDGKSLLT